VSDDLHEILRILECQLQWRSGLHVLLRRIRRVGRNDKFSARQTKLLRKLVNAQKKQGYIDFEEVHDYFPGKTLDMLESKYNEKYEYMLKGRKRRKNNSE